MFIEKIRAAWQRSNSLLCVGIDPDYDRLSAEIKHQESPFFSFGKSIVDATADLVCAFKLNVAYYSRAGVEGELMRTIQYVHSTYPHIPVILDSKRSDFGPTSEMYATEAFDRYQADAVTVVPYLGRDSLQPFLRRKDKGVIIVCHSSNPGSADFQAIEVNNKYLYELVAAKAVNEWNDNNNIILVAGGTSPNAVRRMREIAGDIPILVPGVGAQGGSIPNILESGLDSIGVGLIISASRSILYSSESENFQAGARIVAKRYRDEINLHRSNMGFHRGVPSRLG